MRYTGLIGFVPDAYNKYRDFTSTWNRYVRYTQHYFDPDYSGLESEEEYDWFALLYDYNIPTKGDNDRLKQYMNRHDLEWSDIDYKKALHVFGNGTVSGYIGALNFASDNVRKLYR